MNHLQLRFLLHAKNDPYSQERFLKDLIRTLERLGIPYERRFDKERGRRVIEFPDEHMFTVMHEMQKYRFEETYEYQEINGRLVKRKVVKRRW